MPPPLVLDDRLSGRRMAAAAGAPPDDTRCSGLRDEGLDFLAADELAGRPLLVLPGSCRCLAALEAVGAVSLSASLSGFVGLFGRGFTKGS